MFHFIGIVIVVCLLIVGSIVTGTALAALFNHFIYPKPKEPPMTDIVDNAEQVMTTMETEIAAAVPAPASIISTVEADIEAFIAKVEHVATILEQPLHPLWAEIVALAKKL